MSISPKYSFIMTVYNEENRSLRASIESMLSQTYNDFEIIIVDDCSNDNSPNIIKSYLNNNKLKFIRNDTNLGRAASLNIALLISRGDFIVINDADDQSDSRRLEIIDQVILNNENIDVIGSSFFEKLIKNNEEFVSLHFNDKKLKRIRLWRILLGMPFVHSSVFYNRKMLIDNEGFDEALQSYIDLHTLVKLASRNYKIYRFGVPLVTRNFDSKNFFSGSQSKINNQTSSEYISLWGETNIRFYDVQILPKKLYDYIKSKKIYNYKLIKFIFKIVK